MVVLQLKAILTLEYLNRLVILRMWGGKGEGCPLCVISSVCRGCSMHYSVFVFGVLVCGVG